MSLFNIRVYGLLFDDDGGILVTDEFRFGKLITKFPGGGLIWGEGIINTLKREILEEMGCEIEVLEHFYTTDFFQHSAFHSNQQVISVYYKIKNISALKIKISDAAFDFEKTEGAQSFRWLSADKIKPEQFTYPIEQKVAKLINEQAPK